MERLLSLKLLKRKNFLNSLQMKSMLKTCTLETLSGTNPLSKYRQENLKRSMPRFRHLIIRRH